MRMFATAFAGQFEFDPQTGPARLFTFSIAFWALLMISAYTANLASFLVIRNQPSRSIQSVAQAVQLDLPMCVWKSSQTDASVTQKWSEYAASGRLVRTSQRGVYEGLLNGDCEIAITEVSTWDVFQYDESINGDCALGWIGRPFLTIPASFGVKGDAGTRCTSLLRDVFNLYIHDMEVDGTLTNLWDEHIAFIATVNCGIDPETDDDDAFLRRMVDSNQPDSRKKDNNANENANNQIPRHLKATAAKNAASAATKIRKRSN